MGPDTSAPCRGSTMRSSVRPMRAFRPCLSGWLMAGRSLPCRGWPMPRTARFRLWRSVAVSRRSRQPAGADYDDYFAAAARLACRTRCCRERVPDPSNPPRLLVGREAALHFCGLNAMGDGLSQQSPARILDELTRSPIATRPAIWAPSTTSSTIVISTACSPSWRRRQGLQVLLRSEGQSPAGSVTVLAAAASAASSPVSRA